MGIHPGGDAHLSSFFNYLQKIICFWRGKDQKYGIDQNTQNCSGCNRRQSTGENALQDGDRQEATSITDIAADTNDHDHSANSQVAGAEEADIILNHQRDTLHADHTKEVDR